MKARAYEEIARRAYALWEAEDRADGHHVEHWLRAEATWLAERRHTSHVVVRSKPIRAARDATEPLGARPCAPLKQWC